MRAISAIILAFLLPTLAIGQTIVESPEADATALTIYPDNLAMIREVRTVKVPAGKSTIRFLGVSDQIIAQTAVLQSFEGIRLESNFDSDLITRGALLNKAIGQEITVRRLNPGSGKTSLMSGKLLSASTINSVVQGAVFETADGIEALECAGLPEAIIFSDLPSGLNAKPVLSMEVFTKEAVEVEMVLSYLSQGIGWSADYRLDVEPGQKGSGPLTGWLTVTNDTAKTFKDAPTAIIAGKLNRDKNTASSYIPQKRFASYCWPRGSSKTGIPNNITLYSFNRNKGRLERRERGGLYAPAPEAAVFFDMGAEDEIIVTATKREATLEDFADYKLYRVPQPVTVAALQTKQISFLNVPDAEYERVYKTNLDWWEIDSAEDQEPENSTKEIEIDNSREGNLAKPLPRGTLRVMTKRPNGKTAYLGEANIKDSAIDLPVELRIDESPFVQSVPIIRLAEHEEKPGVQIGVDVLNPMPEDITFEFTLNATDIGVDDIAGSSHPRDLDEARPVYRFRAAAESQTPFFIFFEIIASQHFSHEDIYYDHDEPGDIHEIIAKPGYNLKGVGGRLDWLQDVVDNQAGSAYGEVRMKAKLIALEEFEDPEDLMEYRVTEEFTFSNASDQIQDIVLEFDSDLEYKIETTNITSDNSATPTWQIALQPGKTRVLSVVYLTEDF